MIECFPNILVEEPKQNGRMRLLSCRDRWLLQTFNNIKSRCANPRDKRFKDYGGRGIENFLTLEDLQMLYERDRPDLMLFPSIDRKLNDGPYQFDNCQFLEMLDNRRKAKRRAYPCAQCEISSLLYEFDGRMLCESCVKRCRFESAKYVQYVRFVIDETSARGFDVAAAFRDKAKRRTISPSTLFINGLFVKIHYASRRVRTSPFSRRTYWRFCVHDDRADIHVLVAKHQKARVAYLLVGKPKRKEIYVPVIRPANLVGRPPLYDWPSLKNAWHLLAVAPHQKAVND